LDNLPALLGLATLLPLFSFFVIFIAGPKLGKAGAYVAILAIAGACVLSFVSLAIWCSHHFPEVVSHHGHDEGGHDEGGHDENGHDENGHDENGHSAHLDGKHLDETGEKSNDPADATGADDEEDKEADAIPAALDTDLESPRDESSPSDPAIGTDGEEEAHPARGPPQAISEVYWILGQFGDLRLAIDCYIDGLTIMMFCMVTFIATCIHFYAMGYMHDEEHDITDHEVTLSDGSHLTRPGRFYRFFQYLSLFCFSMLGLVLAGNVAMVFVFWELVGACSYFLIGFYVERKSASTAANKAFIVNRVGDFGFIIGMVALWSTVGTFSFGDLHEGDAVTPGLFSQLRTEANEHQLVPAPEMVLASAHVEVANEVNKTIAANPSATQAELESAVNGKVDDWRAKKGLWGAPYGYWFLIVAGAGIFCGCVGKSAQFPLHVWLPDAMEGPTPVSALVHSATMVAAGVYLVGRFFPVFTPEVLWLIAMTGCITLFMAATIAITATDIKRVLAYSTVSQLGYMMLALGLGGWVAGMMHLVTHAFFKSLLFMCSGSVIHAVHTNEMTEMGGLRKKMPITAYTMLVGCLAISGAGIPVILNVGFSGFYSKDKILEQAYSYMNVNGAPWGAIFFAAAAGGAAITAFYMFRMWYMTFAGTPRDQDRYDHAHESPAVMTTPLVVLAVLAVAVAWNPSQAITGGMIAAVGLIVLVLRNRWACVVLVVAVVVACTAVAWQAIMGVIFWQAITGGVIAAVGLIVLVLRNRSASGEATYSPAQVEHDGHGHDGHGHDDNSAFDLGRTVLISAIVIAVMIGVVNRFPLTLEGLLEQNRPVGTLPSVQGVLMDIQVPSEHIGHDYALFIGPLATFTAILGFALATFMYGVNYLDPGEVRSRFPRIYTFLRNKWYFDELYEVLFVKPAHYIGKFIVLIDQNVIDGFIHSLVKVTKWISRQWDRFADQLAIDGSINWVGRTVRRVGVSLKVVQTGSLRQYVMFIAVGAIAIFVLISFFWSPTLAK
jgi:NADH:ubiquinone oxidoreductase subunit 5 (subunit L)/multisubunit Na+/H+ antiporter MnhA subunit